MAIKINNTTVIDNGRNITNVVGVGDTFSTVFYGDGSNLIGIGTLSGSGDSSFIVGITSTFQTNDVQGFEDTIFTFPSTSGKRYIVQSIVATNISETPQEINLTTALDFVSKEKAYITFNTPIPIAGSIEILKEPQVMNLSDSIRMSALDNQYNGILNSVDVVISFAETNDINFFGVGFGTGTIINTNTVGVYTSSTVPSIINSIRLTNITDGGDHPVSISITNGTTTSFIAKNLLIPRYASVELLERQKRLETNGKISVQVETFNTVNVVISGKQIIA